MAKKMYYNEQEAAEKLGMSAEELAGLVSEGKLKAYADGAKRMFKTDDVDGLVGTMGTAAGEELIELAPSDTGTSDSISLDTGEEKSPPTKEDTVITSEGISIFDDEDLEVGAADPLAKTQVAPTPEDQASLEGAGSGSGLLDLTRESDDTSLGAEVLGHIDMESVGSSIGGEAITEAPSETFDVPETPAAAAEQVVVLEQSDPSAGLFSGMLTGAVIVTLIIMAVALAAMSGGMPSYLTLLNDNVLIVTGIAAALIVISAVVGMLLGKPASPKAA